MYCRDIRDVSSWDDFSKSSAWWSDLRSSLFNYIVLKRVASSTAGQSFKDGHVNNRLRKASLLLIIGIKVIEREYPLVFVLKGVLAVPKVSITPCRRPVACTLSALCVRSVV